MITDHLRRVIERLSVMPPALQDQYATELEVDLDEREQQRIAAQLADPQATDLDYLLAQADEQSAQGQVYDLNELLKTLDFPDAKNDQEGGE